MRRCLALSEGNSNKFWRVEVDGDTVHVHYGRRGTNGQRKAKTYADEAAALADAEKQVAAKVKKGYAHEPDDGEAIIDPTVAPSEATAPSRPRAASTKKASTAPESPVPATAATSDQRAPASPAAPTPTPQVEVAAGDDGLGLLMSPFDLASNVDIPLSELPEIPRDDAPFDPEAEAERARRIVVEAPMESNSYSGARKGHIAAEPVFTSVPSLERFEWWVTHYPGLFYDTYSASTTSLYRALIGGTLDEYVLRHCSSRAGTDGRGLQNHDARGAVHRLRPFLAFCSEETRRALAEAQENPLPVPVMVGHYYSTVNDLSPLLLAMLGERRDQITEALDGIPNNYFATDCSGDDSLELCVSAESPEARVALAKRIGAKLPMPIYDPNYALWIANTGAPGVDLLLRLVEDAPSAPEGAWHVRSIGALVHGPAAVPGMARLASGSRGQDAAADWLHSHVASVLASDTPQAYAAVVATVLRPQDSQVLTEALPTARGAARSAIETILAERDMPELAPDGHDEAWRVAADAITPAQLRKVPKWLDAARFPALVVDGARLSAQDVRLLVADLVAAGGGDSALAAYVRERATTRSRDAFAIALLGEWLRSGAAAKDKWVLPGAGRIGHDGYALELTPMVRAWPGQAQHKRATVGIESLRAVGTDTALAQLSGIASKVKFQALKRAAQEAMEEIAEEMGLSRAELEDRIVPDGGLGERGTRRFDYGPRAFLVGIGPDCKLVVREEGPDGRPTGKAKTTLPKPTTKDDAALAEDSKAEFTQLRKSLTSLAKLQVARFEQAMIGGRSWTEQQHRDYIATHPLLRPLLAGLVWLVSDSSGTVVATARIDEDASLVDAEDNPVEIPKGGSIRIAHPLDLDEETRSAWGETLGDYELVAPFRQLDRPVFTLPEGQGETEKLAGLDSSAAYPATTLLGAFSRAGWVRGPAYDNGTYRQHSLQFPAADMTAMITYEGLTIGWSPAEQEDQSIEEVIILPGLRSPEELGWGAWDLKDSAKVPWTKVPPTVVSEVLATLHAITDKE